MVVSVFGLCAMHVRMCECMCGCGGVRSRVWRAASVCTDCAAAMCGEKADASYAVLLVGHSLVVVARGRRQRHQARWLAVAAAVLASCTANVVVAVAFVGG